MNHPDLETSRGSEWRRWDPHIHAPGTLLNDEFGGDWEGYLQALENASPLISALGVTDYFGIQTYREVRRRKAEGRLPGIQLLFPNVEVRLDVKTEKGPGINLHLLFSPFDSDHEERIERTLRRFTIEVDGETFACVRDDLARLGKKHIPGVSGATAVSEGANQFKVSLAQLKQVFRSDDWLQQNCLIAACASSTDGTAGIQHDDSFASFRQEILRTAHVIFAGTPSERTFWLGQKEGSPPAWIEETFGSLKPCLHGSDAHRLDLVAAPAQDRFCWIKGDLSFEALRQAVLEPEERVWIGAEPPTPPPSSSCISRVEIFGAPWIENKSLDLNQGMIAIIGPRGSGKTALADIIAVGAGAMTNSPGASSFLYRAAEQLLEEQVQLTWYSGETSAAKALGPPWQTDDLQDENARYLSQHFVEELCSSAGLASELRKEMERLVFLETDPTDRLEAESFDQLVDTAVNPIRERRGELQKAIDRISDEVAREESLKDRLPDQKKACVVLEKQLESDRKQLGQILPKGMQERGRELSRVETVCRAAEAQVENLRLRRKSADDLRAETQRILANEPSRVSEMRRRFNAAGLELADWDLFQMVFKGDVAALLTKKLQELDQTIDSLINGKPGLVVNETLPPTVDWPVIVLRRHRDQLKKDVGADAGKQRTFDILQRAVNENDLKLGRLHEEIKHAEGADMRRRTLLDLRKETYTSVVDTFVEEEEALRTLYLPLAASFHQSTGALSKLKFVVQRSVDIVSWASEGEQLLDLRNAGEFRGQGSLANHAQMYLLKPWRGGTSEEVARAIEGFREHFGKDIVAGRPGTIATENRPRWNQQVGAWLYGTHHLRVRYSIEYDGVPIEQLSPGTRGIVLLLLYLAVDHHDRRPLIIDQPEENLDPNSVFRELVPHFRQARKRRQVIIVTHNANLVVNADVDQVIVAAVTSSPTGGLPTMSYRSGSLEHPTIRRLVCDILEGGERAFLERERRYRLRWGQAIGDASAGEHS